MIVPHEKLRKSSSWITQIRQDQICGLGRLVALGAGHAKWLKTRKMSSKNGSFLVLNIPFWVQNCRPKDFCEI